MSRLWQLTAVVVAVFLAVGAGLWLLGDDESGPSGELVDAISLQRCLGAADPAVEGWGIETSGADPVRSDPALGGFVVDWGRHHNLQLAVVADRADAVEIDSRLGEGEAVTESWDNVLMHRESKPPAKVTGAIQRCSDEAASAAGVDGSSFEECGDADTADGRYGPKDLEVRGTSCEAGAKLAEQFSSDSPVCTSESREHLCASFNVCCGIFISYLGSEDEAVIYESGI